jgi:hypothetical protein
MLGYIDFSLGAMVLQALAAGVLTVLYFCKNSIAKLFSGVKSLFSKK